MAQETREITVRATMHRWKVQHQRKARNADSVELWHNQGALQTSIGQKAGDQAPPPKIPNTPSGFTPKGWKEDSNKVFAELPKAPAIGPPPDPTYDPKQSGKASSSNDGEGTPPTGYVWTAHVRKKVILEEVVYTMTYVFVKKST